MEISSNGMPTPKDLAKKEATRTISLRVKEKTMLEFEKYAQIYNVTASLLINGLLDSYIEEMSKKDKKSDSYEQVKLAASRKVMAQYLEKLAGRVGITSDEDLCYTLASDTEYANIDNLEPYNYYQDILCFREDKDNCSMGTDSVFMGDKMHTEFMCCGEDECTFDFDEQNIVMVPAEKYPVVGNMILGYVKKFNNLYQNSQEKINIATIKKLVNIINETEDLKELARKIAKALAEYEGMLDE